MNFLGIFVALQFIGIYIGIIFLSYYLIRKFFPSGNDEKDVTLDKIAAVFWIFTIILLIMYGIGVITQKVIQFFNNLLTQIGNLAESNKNKGQDEFSTHFPKIRNNGEDGVAVRQGDVVVSYRGLDIGIVESTRSDGSPIRICSSYSPYSNELHHCNHYGGIETIDWYLLPINMSLITWENLTKSLYDTGKDNVYSYFSEVIGYPLPFPCPQRRTND